MRRNKSRIYGICSLSHIPLNVGVTHWGRGAFISPPVWLCISRLDIPTATHLRCLRLRGIRWVGTRRSFFLRIILCVYSISPFGNESCELQGGGANWGEICTNLGIFWISPLNRPMGLQMDYYQLHSLGVKIRNGSLSGVRRFNLIRLKDSIIRSVVF